MDVFCPGGLPGRSAAGLCGRDGAGRCNMGADLRKMAATHLLPDLEDFYPCFYLSDPSRENFFQKNWIFRKKKICNLEKMGYTEME